MMTKHQRDDFLLEIGTEELPPKTTNTLAKALADEISLGLNAANLDFTSIEHFSTPRRLAVRVNDLLTLQKTLLIEKKGPAKAAAFDAQGKPTKALLGFLRSANATLDDIQEQETPKGIWLTIQTQKKGHHSDQILPDIVAAAIKKLPIAKMMRWSDRPYQFVRPVHWLVMLLGDKVVPGTLFGHDSTAFTRGHRFLFNDMIQLHHPREYEEMLLTRGHVMANTADRKANILQEVTTIADELNAVAIIDDALLNEVTNLVEWPTALLCTIDQALLSIPDEALIKAMQTHQKSFPVTNKQGKLLPYFITVSNIQSHEPKHVIHGNENVMNARLKDAAFFYDMDQKTPLINHVETLKRITYQKKLGSLFDKTTRIQHLALWLAKQLDINPTQTERAALLCKADLVTEMVGEFPALQGIMGHYYAQLNGEPKAVALALEDAYKPISAKGDLPESDLGALLAIADKTDTLIAIFGVGLKPSGAKDPFALRRAALGLIRILLAKQWPISLNQLFAMAASPLKEKINPEQTCQTVLTYCQERLKAYYKEQGIDTDVFQAVSAVMTDWLPVDIDRRLQAVNDFKHTPKADMLSATNKRIQNILNKNLPSDTAPTIQKKWLDSPQEITLHHQLIETETTLIPLIKDAQYTQVLNTLTSLQGPIDDFFQHVMVMCDDNHIKDNRLALLFKLRSLFLLVADISKLQI